MLEIRKLKKVFSKKSFNEKIALDNIDLNLGSGEFVTVVGGNGSGKSTLFNCISGAEAPDKGRIILEGEDITYLAEYQRAVYIGRVFQDPLKGTAHDMTIEENLSLAYSKGSRRGFARAITKGDIIKFQDQLATLNLDLEKRLKQKVGLLSGGQRQALTLLMATFVNPKLLLLDEHTAALDPSTAKLVMSLTAQIVNEKKISTIMITHNLRDALEFGSRTIMLSSGKITLDIEEEDRKQVTADKLLEKLEQ